jgi:peptide chain release factor 2/peptide chain release factor
VSAGAATHWVLTVSSGSGPVEVRRFAALLAGELEARLAASGCLVESAMVHGDEDAPRSVDLAVFGPRARVEPLVGTHVLLAKSAERGRRARKRWFVGVELSETRRRAARVSVDPPDLEITCCRASGAGGQHLQKTASAVRVLHRPSGISVRVETERSQHRNRALAVERLEERLAELAEEQGRGWEERRRRRCLQVVRGAPVGSWRLVEGRLVSSDG